jgi:hypothetical protein
MFPQEQTTAGVERFANRRLVRVLLRRLPYVEKKLFTSPLLTGKTVPHLTLRFASKSEANAASDRIMEEHRGGPFCSICGPLNRALHGAAGRDSDARGRHVGAPPPFFEAPMVLDYPTTRGLLFRASTRGRMASLAQPPLGESSGAYQGPLYTFGLTGYGVNKPAHEAGPFLPATPFPGGMRQRTTQILHGFPRQNKAKKLASY